MTASEIELADWESGDLDVQPFPPDTPITSNNGGLDPWDSDPANQPGQSPAYFSRGQSVLKPLIITCGPLLDSDSGNFYGALISLSQFWSNTESPAFAPVIKDFDLYERKRDFASGIDLTLNIIAPEEIIKVDGASFRTGLPIPWPSEPYKYGGRTQVSQESATRRIDLTNEDVHALHIAIQILPYRNRISLIYELANMPSIITAHNDDKTMRVVETQIAPYADAPSGKILSFFFACESAGG